jgi:transposase
MMGRQERQQGQLFYEFNLDDVVPKDHLLRRMNVFVTAVLADLHQQLEPFYSDIGRPSIDPELMIRMLIVGYCYGIRHERRLCEEVKLHLAYRWFCKLDLDDRVPHHSTFSINRLDRFRDSDILRHVFERVVAVCMASGLVKGEGFAVDASVMEANASRYHGKAPDFMLLPASQCEIIDTWTVGGLRGTGSHDVAVRDVFVPIAFASGFFDTYVLPEPRYRIPAFSRVIPGLGAMALGIASTAIETLREIAGAKIPVRTTQMLRDTPDAQVRVSQAEALVRSARLFLFDSLAQLWTKLLATGEVTMEARALARLAASHAVSSAVQAVDLMYVAGGASSIYVSCPLERAFRDVHTMTQHIGVHPRVMHSTGRVLFGLESDTPLL